MGKDLRGKELGVGISQRSDEFYVGRYTTKHESVNKNYSENYKSVDSGWQIHNIKMNIVI